MKLTTEQIEKQIDLIYDNCEEALIRELSVTLELLQHLKFRSKFKIAYIEIEETNRS